MATKMKLAEALLLRKQLQEKVDQLRTISNADVYRRRVQRQRVEEGIDEVVADVPLLQAKEVTAEFDYYSKRLRLVDAQIQQANWSVELEFRDDDTIDKSFPAMEMTREKE